MREEALLLLAGLLDLLLLLLLLLALSTGDMKDWLRPEDSEATLPLPSLVEAATPRPRSCSCCCCCKLLREVVD